MQTLEISTNEATQFLAFKLNEWLDNPYFLCEDIHDQIIKDQSDKERIRDFYCKWLGKAFKENFFSFTIQKTKEKIMIDFSEKIYGFLRHETALFKREEIKDFDLLKEKYEEGKRLLDGKDFKELRDKYGQEILFIDDDYVLLI